MVIPIALSPFFCGHGFQLLVQTILIWFSIKSLPLKRKKYIFEFTSDFSNLPGDSQKTGKLFLKGIFNVVGRHCNFKVTSSKPNADDVTHKQLLAKS